MRGSAGGCRVRAGPEPFREHGRTDDSKKLTEKTREELFPLIRRYALAYHVVFIPAAEVDRRGVHAANIEGMRRRSRGFRSDPDTCSPMDSGSPGCRCPRCRW